MIIPNKDIVDLFKKTPGAISVHEMIAICNVAAMVPDGTYAEMGSHRGKSGVAAAFGLSRPPHGRILHLVDPLYDMSNLEAWAHSCQGHPDNAWQGAKEKDFKKTVGDAILAASSGCVEPQFHGDYSTNAIPRIHAEYGDYAYVFLDSDQHQYELVKSELELLRDRMVVGGVIAFHDFGSQYLGVEQAYREMIGSFSAPTFVEVPIPWDEIKGIADSLGGERGNESWHHCDKERPMFFGALVRVR